MDDIGIYDRPKEFHTDFVQSRSQTKEILKNLKQTNQSVHSTSKINVGEVLKILTRFFMIFHRLYSCFVAKNFNLSSKIITVSVTDIVI